jgi:phosphonatase-like hydrolase
MLNDIKLIIFDMSGTTVKDYNKVLDCFSEALIASGIYMDKKSINTMMGWSKIEVFETIWRNELQNNHDTTASNFKHLVHEKAQYSFRIFKEILENWYIKNPIEPTVGCLELFEYLQKKNIKIAINTGFYRAVADIIFKSLHWEQGKTFDWSITSDEVLRGRPAPYMIQAAMAHYGITDPKQVIKIGDTPSDLQEGRAAGVWSFGVTNGSHTFDELKVYENDGLFSSQSAFLDFLRNTTTN